MNKPFVLFVNFTPRPGGPLVADSAVAAAEVYRKSKKVTRPDYIILHSKELAVFASRGSMLRATQWIPAMLQHNLGERFEVTFSKGASFAGCRKNFYQVGFSADADIVGDPIPNEGLHLLIFRVKDRVGI